MGGSISELPVSEPAVLLLAAAIFGVAVLYASVGHGGATGYIAVMSLAGLLADTIRPTALVLNALVSSLATLRYVRAGHLRLSLLVPLGIASVPAANVDPQSALPRSANETGPPELPSSPGGPRDSVDASRD